MEASSRPYDPALYNQIEEAYGKVVYTYTTQVIHAGRLYKRYKVLKWGAVNIISHINRGLYWNADFQSNCIDMGWWHLFNCFAYSNRIF